MPAIPPRHRRVRTNATVPRALALASLALALTGGPARAFDPPKAIPDGWNGTLAFGAEGTTGATRTSSVTFDSALTGRAGWFELAGRLRVVRNKASIEVAREIDGEPALDADGEPISDRVSKRTRDRRGISVEPRWFFTGKHLYAFGLFDYEVDRPAGVRESMRQITGVGYRLWDSKKNYLAAGVGIGHKRLEKENGDGSDDGIGYLGVRLVVQLSDRAKLDTSLDSDFGGETAFTELGIALGYALTDKVSLKFDYEARVNEGLADSSGRDDGGVDGRLSLKLELDVL